MYFKLYFLGLENSGLKKEDLYSIEIIGGSSRVPCFKSAVKEVFGLEPSTTLNTDEAAARGAALKCAILSPTFRVREFNIVDSVINEVTINWSADGTGANSGNLKIFEAKGQFPFTKAMTIFRKVIFQLKIMKMKKNFGFEKIFQAKKNLEYIFPIFDEIKI